MKRIILTYGAIAGTVAILSVIASIVLGEGEGYQEHLEWLGYLIMLMALSMVFVGIKRYRDQELGGVITFGTGFLVGIGIAAIAGLIYVLVWEIYLAMTDYTFIHSYARFIIESKTASGVSGAELKALESDMARMVEQYGRPLYRLPVTFMEIFPVGLFVSLISAAVLRKSEVMPAK